MNERNNQPNAEQLVQAGKKHFNEAQLEQALAAFTQAAELGSAEANFELGKLHDFAGDHQAANEHFEKAAQAQFGPALLRQGYIYFLSEDGRAEEVLKAALATGQTRAAVVLGQLFAGLEQLDEAREWFNSALDSGELEALFELGCIADNPTQARQWFMQSFEAGDRRAPNALGLLEQEEGDENLARSWFQVGAKNGDATSMFNLGSLDHEEGNLEEAKYWYVKSFDAGESGAVTVLGLLAEDMGDLEGARVWYRKAALDGDPYAMHNLSVLEAKSGNTDEAEDWLRRALDAGYDPNEAADSED